MGLFLEGYAEDEKKQSGGTPIYIADATFYVKRWGTIESQKFIREIKREIFGPLHKYSDDDENVLLAHWLADYAVTGWDDVLTEEGGPLKFSASTARKVFLNPAYFLSLNRLIYIEASKFENYLFESAAEDIDTLKKS